MKRYSQVLVGISALTICVLPFTPRSVSSLTAGVPTPPRSSVMNRFNSSRDKPTETKVNPRSIAQPPMGWSSWNSFSNTVDSDVVMRQTRALVASGMKQAGYQYINIDEGWWLGARDHDGNILVSAKQWPALQPGEQDGDMSNIVRFVHRAGLKAGIYTDAGEAGCGFYGPDIGPPMPHTGSEGHYDQDFLQFAQWGFDYVKVDWCGGSKENLDPAVQYAEIARSIHRAEKITGHRLYFSICNWGNNSPWTWAPGIGGVDANIWRTSGDIVAPIVIGGPNADRKATLAGVLKNFDEGIHPSAQHTGFYNDPDMMMVGMPGLSEVENRLHMTLWAMSGAPLLVGADLTKLNQATIEILTNRDVLAVDQDALGLQAIKVAEPHPGLQVWSKPLAEPGQHAVMLLNRSNTPAQISVDWKQIGLRESSPAVIKELWSGKELGSYSSSFAATVPANDALLLTIGGTNAKPDTYEASGSSDRGAALNGESAVLFKTAPIKTPTFVQIHYLNPGKSPFIAQLRVDGQMPTNILFPPTGDRNQIGTISIEVESAQEKPQTTFSFSSVGPTEVTLQSVSVLAGRL